MKDIALQEALALLDVCPVAMLVTGDDGNIRGYNQAFSALVGTAPETLPADLLAPLLGQGTLVNWIMQDGDQRWLAVETVTLGDIPGSSVRFYSDVTEKLQLRKERDTLADKLRKQALRDEQLTGLLSRHGVLVSLEPLVARSRRGEARGDQYRSGAKKPLQCGRSVVHGPTSERSAEGGWAFAG